MTRDDAHAVTAVLMRPAVFHRSMHGQLREMKLYAGSQFQRLIHFNLESGARYVNNRRVESCGSVRGCQPSRSFRGDPRLPAAILTSVPAFVEAIRNRHLSLTVSRLPRAENSTDVLGITVRSAPARIRLANAPPAHVC